MPRPKPSFEDYKHLFDGLNYKLENETNFIINSKIILLCEKGHEYYLTIGEIKRFNKNPKECPHCKNKLKYSQKGIPYSFFETYANKYNFHIKNKKDYYSRWEDSIVFVCNKCNEHEIEVKALSYLEKHTDRKLTCEKCENNLLSKTEFNNEINNIYFKKELIILKTPIDYNILPEALKEKILLQNKWIIYEYQNTKTKGKFQCKDCGYLKTAYPHSLFIGRGFGCINCDKIKKRISVYEKIKEACKISECIPIIKENFYDGVWENIVFKCNKCGEEFEHTWKQIYDNKYKLICSNCSKPEKSNSEILFVEYIREIYNEEIVHRDRKMIPPYELDVYLPLKNIAIEFCGGIWHSSKYSKDNYRHRDKFNMCEKQNIRLITMFEDEWNEKKEICKSRIRNLLGITKQKIMARKCEVKEIETKTALNFCEKYHIQGKGQTNESYGLFYNNELVSVMTFSKPSVAKRAKDYDWELNRFCSIFDTVVVGGASKLFKQFILKHPNNKIVSFCDLRWGNGKVYENLGFKLLNTTRPNYYYFGEFTGWKRKHRFNFTKQNLIKIFNETNDSLTEEQIAAKNGLYKIYDCGHLKYYFNSSFHNDNILQDIKNTEQSS